MLFFFACLIWLHLSFPFCSLSFSFDCSLPSRGNAVLSTQILENALNSSRTMVCLSWRSEKCNGNFTIFFPWLFLFSLGLLAERGILTPRTINEKKVRWIGSDGTTEQCVWHNHAISVSYYVERIRMRGDVLIRIRTTESILSRIRYFVSVSTRTLKCGCGSARTR